jgi:diguanylate cyclase (GGDEF)-like protein
MSFKFRIQLLIASLIILTSTFFTVYYIHHEYEYNAERVKKSSQNIERTFKLILDDINHFYTYRAYANLRSTGVMSAMRERNKDQLYDLTLPRYNTMRDENPNLMLMQFHAPDGKSILRMHRVEVFGDDIAARRPMLRKTHVSQQVQTGFEGGIEGVAYRIIVPMVEKKEYIGALEFGVDPDYIISRLIQSTKMDTLFMLHESKMAAADAHRYSYGYSGYHFAHLSPYQKPMIKEFVKENPELNQRVITYKGKKYDVMHIHISSSDGRPVGLLVCFNDITADSREIAQIILESIGLTIVILVLFLLLFEYAYKMMSKQLLYQDKYISTILNSQKNIIVVTDGKEIRYVNNAFYEYLHYATLEAFKKDYICICYLFETNEKDNYLQPVMDGQTWTEYIVSHKDREHIAKMTVNGKSSIFSVNAQLMEFEKDVRYVVVFNDITELNEMATMDRLTKIANRLEFDKRLEHSISIAKRYQRSFSILLLDIDHFKHINDRFGHLVGDEVLKEFTSVIGKQIRESDFVARWGGEEFVILLTDTELSSAIKMAEVLRQRIEIHSFEHVHKITCSIGVAEFNTIEAADDLLNRADKKLYDAKAGGRNRIMA